MAFRTKEIFEKELRLLVWELRDNPYRRFLVAFLLIWAIPFPTILYLIIHGRYGADQISIPSIIKMKGNMGHILFAHSAATEGNRCKDPYLPA